VRPCPLRAGGPGCGRAGRRTALLDRGRPLMTAPKMHPLYPRNATITFSVDVEAPQALDPQGLHDVREVAHLLSEVLSGLKCQPRFNSDYAVLNRAGELIDDLHQVVDCLQETAVNVARSVPDDGDDWRRLTIVGFAADMGDLDSLPKPAP